MTVPAGIAHRGEPVGFRENTLPAIRAAVAAGADLVEVDLQLTSDGELVLLHDETLERLWGDLRPVAAVDLADLTRRHRGDGAVWRVPTLDEAIELMVELDTRLMLDFTALPVGVATADAVRRHGVVDRVLYAGNTDALAAIRARQPDAAIAMTWERRELPAREVWERVRPQYFNPQWRLLDETMVAEMHAAGRLVSAWTVDDRADMTGLVAMGVDAVISNRIGELVDVLAGSVR